MKGCRWSAAAGGSSRVEGSRGSSGPTRLLLRFVRLWATDTPLFPSGGVPEVLREEASPRWEVCPGQHLRPLLQTPPRQTRAARWKSRPSAVPGLDVGRGRWGLVDAERPGPPRGGAAHPRGPRSFHRCGAGDARIPGPGEGRGCPPTAPGCPFLQRTGSHPLCLGPPRLLPQWAPDWAACKQHEPISRSSRGCGPGSGSQHGRGRAPVPVPCPHLLMW